MELHQMAHQVQELFREREHLMAQLQSFHQREEANRLQAGQVESAFASNLVNYGGGGTTPMN
eukprot:2151048-Pyramimonas_sp.AAC.1